MGLSIANITLLTLTARKADVEEGLTLCSLRKMSLTREQSDLSKEYYSRLQQKDVSYYHNGEYSKINYNYIMGYGSNYTPITSGNRPLKEDNSMVLSDYKGQVVMSDAYADVIKSVLGASALDSKGQGRTFSTDRIPEMLAKLIPGYSAEEFKTIIDGKGLNTNYNSDTVNTLTGEDTGQDVVINNSDKTTEILSSIVDFYYPIFAAAAANGWTTEYNEEMKYNENYISDAIMSGTFQLATVSKSGNYDPDTSLTYFVTAGLVDTRTDAETREEITAWYNAEKDRIGEKENENEIETQELSTELEAINARIQSTKSLLEDGMSAFEWGT